MTAPTWQCAACATYNAVGETACEICGTAKTVAKPAATRAPATAKAKAKAPARKAAAASGSAADRRKLDAPKRRKTAASSGATPGAKSAAEPAGKSAAKPAAKSGAAKPAAKPAAKRPAKHTSSATSADSLASSIFERDGELRATTELAALMPELFHPDGTLRTPPADPGLHRAWGRIGPTVADGGVLDIPDDVLFGPRGATRPTARRSTPTARGSTPPAARRASAARAGARPEPSTKDQVVGCSCLFVVVAGVVTAIVMLILHWHGIFG